jgi:uncharacterized RDD family membrane protein YckC
MNCTYCRSWNAEDEHRCTRCGRLLRRASAAGAVAAAYPLHLTSGSLATSSPASVMDEREPAKVPPPRIIPFESISRRPLAQPTAIPAPVAPLVVAVPAPQRAPARRRVASEPNDRQTALDFLVAPLPGPRTLKTSVEALIICDAPVATPRHRAIAASLDTAVVAAGFVIFLLTFQLLGGEIRIDRGTAPWFGAAFLAVIVFYGILWTLAGRDTAGMRWSGLRLIDFDGYAPDRTARTLRLVGTCVSLCAGGMGLAWALFDEEQLGWNDHMSKTFPTLQESNSNFLRKRRK